MLSSKGIKYEVLLEKSGLKVHTENITLLPDHGVDNELKKESYLGRSGLRSHMLKTGSLTIEFTMNKKGVLLWKVWVEVPYVEDWLPDH